MATTADQLVGRTIYAKKRVPLLRWPQDDSPVLRYVEPGQRIGVIRGWSDKRPAQKFWYFEFDDNKTGRAQHSVFFVPYEPSILDLPRLGTEYQDQREAERRRNLEWWERLAEDGAEVVTNTASAAGAGILTGAVLLGGLYILVNKRRGK
jgi:hypothetical protein